jgi:hypothetical protein
MATDGGEHEIEDDDIRPIAFEMPEARCSILKAEHLAIS